MSKSEAKAFIDLSDKILAENWIDLFQCLFKKKKKKANLDHFVSVYVVQRKERGRACIKWHYQPLFLR